MARTKYHQQPTSDIGVQDHGSHASFRRLAARAHRRDVVRGRPRGGARYAADLLRGAVDDGFRIELGA